MKILIVGSKGFIGSYCLDYFNNKFQVWGCDVVVDYTDERYFLINTSLVDFDNIFKSNQFDVCINCSGAASVHDSVIDPSRDFFLNSVNVFLILDAIRKYSPNCKFLNLSTAAVYGNPINLPVKETDRIQPVSPYGFHKMQAEDHCDSFFKIFRINTCSARIFSAFGPGLKKQLFWDIYSKTKKGEAIRFFGTGQETRDFIFIEDLVQALDSIVKNAPFEGEKINVASGIETPIEVAVETMLNELKWKGHFSFIGQTRQGDPINWSADISLLNSYGFKPEFSLQNGLKIYSKWLKENE